MVFQAMSLCTGALLAAVASLATMAGAQSPCGSVPTVTVFPVDSEPVLGAGSALAMSGDGRKVAIGSFSHSHGGIASGAAWVISDPGTPVQSQAEIRPAGAQTNMFFGSALAMNADGNVLVVGAPGYPGNGSNTSTVFVYRYDGANWNEEFRTSLIAGND